MADRNTELVDRVEALAQTIHQYRHRAGTAGVCGPCRDEAIRQLAAPPQRPRRSWLRRLIGVRRG